MPTTTSEFTGLEIDTFSEDWRHECEVRHIVDNIPTRELRNAHLGLVAKIRGQAAADHLRAESMRLWEIRQARLKSA
jgi:hypothetical protein